MLRYSMFMRPEASAIHPGQTNNFNANFEVPVEPELLNQDSVVSRGLPRKDHDLIAIQIVRDLFSQCAASAFDFE
jgi:hypothetical protein